MFHVKHLDLLPSGSGRVRSDPFASLEVAIVFPADQRGNQSGAEPRGRASHDQPPRDFECAVRDMRQDALRQVRRKGDQEHRRGHAQNGPALGFRFRQIQTLFLSKRRLADSQGRDHQRFRR